MADTDAPLAEQMQALDNLTAPAALLGDANPISLKMRACFYLRTENSEDAVKLLLKVTSKKGESVLLRHEAAYCLGQMKRESAIAGLLEVLNDREDDVIVRHECAEALGAIGNEGLCKGDLTRIAQDQTEPREVQETCQLALDRFSDHAVEASAGEVEGLNTVDPAKVCCGASQQETIQALEEKLNSTSNRLYERYQAMFMLRNRSINGPDSEAAVHALGKALLNKNQGALFRHEVAFVFGQLSHPLSVPYLKSALEDVSLHEMVRHESVEALGGVRTEEALGYVKEYLDREGEAVIVRESCQVALDAASYWQEFENQTH